MRTLLAALLAAGGAGEDPADPEVAALVESLGAEEVEERERAAAGLRRLGARALRAVERAREDSDPEVAARARDLYPVLWRELPLEESAKLPFERLHLADIDLHTLSVAVGRVTGKTILWTEDLGLGKRRASLVSDLPLKDRPEILFRAYQAVLQVHGLVLVEADPGFRIRPSPVRI